MTTEDDDEMRVRAELGEIRTEELEEKFGKIVREDVILEHVTPIEHPIIFLRG